MNISVLKTGIHPQASALATKTNASISFKSSTKKSESEFNSTGLNALAMQKSTLVQPKRFLSIDEISQIKNLTGSLENKVKQIIEMYLLKTGYEPDLIKFEIYDKEDNEDEETSKYEAAYFNGNTGELGLHRSKVENLSNEQLAILIFHELRHFEQSARLYKQIGIDRAEEVRNKSNLEFEDKIKNSLISYINTLNEAENAYLNGVLSEEELNEILTTIKKKSEEAFYYYQKSVGIHFDRSFWQRAISQTKATENFNSSLTVENLKPAKIKRTEENKDIEKILRLVEYYSDPYEYDAYSFQVKTGKELGANVRDIETNLFIAKLKRSVYEQRYGLES